MRRMPETLTYLDRAVRTVLTALWEAVMAGRERLSLVWELLRHLPAHGHNLVCNTRDPALPTSINWLEGWLV